MPLDPVCQRLFTRPRLDLVFWDINWFFILFNKTLFRQESRVQEQIESKDMFNVTVYPIVYP